MVNSSFPKLKAIASAIIGSCVIASLFHQSYLLQSATVDRPPTRILQRKLLLEKASASEDTHAVYRWARRHVRPHARLPEPSKETILFWHIPKSGGSTAKSIYRCIGKTIRIASQPGEIMKLKHMGLAPSEQPDIIFSSFPDFAIAHLYDETHKARVLAMFRHPVDRLVSKFYYLQVASWEKSYQPKWAKMDILQWAKSYHNTDNNLMVKRLAGKGQRSPTNHLDLMRAKRTIRQRMIVGVMDEMGESIHRFNTVMGINDKTENNHHKCMKQYFGSSGKGNRNRKANSNSYPKIEKGHPAWDYLAEKNKFDIKLYEFVLELFEEQREQIDSYARALLS